MCGTIVLIIFLTIYDMDKLSGVAMLLAVIGAINMGLVGLGFFLGVNLNVLNLLLGTLPTVEMVVYVLVGVSGLMVGYYYFVTKQCRMH